MNKTSNTAKIIKATDKQITFLRQLGYAGDASALTLSQASKLIEELKHQATSKQAEFLRKLGWVGSVKTLTFEEASELIERYLPQIEEAKERILDNANLLDMAGRYVQLKRETRDEFSGPCPKCGGDDRFHVTTEWFMCRQCHEKRGDAIEFHAWLNNTSFLDAVIAIDGGAISAPTGDLIKPVKSIVLSPTWNEAYQFQNALNAHSTLLDGGGRYAMDSREYLDSRGITLETAKAFKLGCRTVNLPNTWDYESEQESYPKQPAILLPWINRDGSLVSIKYRFLETHEYIDINAKSRKENKTSRGASRGHLFGWQAVKGPEHNNVLIITEGEINAPSLWQAGNGLIDVLSTGTESMMQTLPAEIIDFAKQYEHRIVWADKGEIADATALAIGAASMRSPGGQDANDLLVAGKLEKLLKAMLNKIGATVESELMNRNWGDLVDYIGSDVDADTWHLLQDECYRRHGDAWTLHAHPVDAGYHLTGISAVPA